jgi:hypothetical protein
VFFAQSMQVVFRNPATHGTVPLNRDEGRHQLALLVGHVNAREELSGFWMFLEQSLVKAFRKAILIHQQETGTLFQIHRTTFPSE